MARPGIQECLTNLNAGLDAIGEFTPKQKDEMLENSAVKVSRLIKKYEAKNSSDIAADVMKELKSEALDVLIAKTITERNALYNKQKLLDKFDYMTSVWDEIPVDGFKAIFRGSPIQREGALQSVAASMEARSGKYLAAFYSDMAKAGEGGSSLWADWTSGKFDKEVFIARDRLDKGADVSDLTPNSVKMAEILNTHMEYARQKANFYGAMIGKLDGYATTRSHNADKIRGSKEKWVNTMLRDLDLEETFSDMEAPQIETAINELYHEFAIDKHVKVGGETTHNLVKGFSSVAKRLSHQRVLKFKTPEAEYNYFKDFGAGNLSKSTMFNLQRLAGNTSLMAHFGPNPDQTIDNLADMMLNKLKKEGRTDEAHTLNVWLKGAKSSLIPHITGEARAIDNPTLAKANHFITALMQSTTLGAAVLSMPSDLAIIAGRASFNGRGYWGGMTDALGGLAQGRTKKEYYDVLSQIGVIADAISGSVISRFDVGDLPTGRVADGMQKFFKYTGIQWWPDRVREGFALGTSHYLARNADTLFDDLTDEIRRMLQGSGIEAADWDNVIRFGKQSVEGDEREFLTADFVRSLGEENYINALKAKGKKPTKAAIENYREDLQDKFLTMFNQENEHAIIQGDVQTRAWLRGGGHQGTWWGMARSQITMLKTFPVAFIQKVLAPAIYGSKSSGKFTDGLTDPSSMLHLAQTIAGMTALGYVSMAAKDLAKGKEVRVPDDEKEFAKIFGAAMMQGGGLGLYGDFLFAETNRFGGNFTSSMMGPAFQRGNELMDIKNKMMSGEKFGGQLLRAAVNNTPGSNVFWARPILDGLILNEFTEMVNPGYLRRTEKRIKKEYDQDYYMRPATTQLDILP